MHYSVDLPSLHLPSLIRLHIVIHPAGIPTITVLHRLLFTAILPILKSFTVEFRHLPYISSQDFTQDNGQDPAERWQPLLHLVFHPFHEHHPAPGRPNSAISDDEYYSPIFTASTIRRLHTLRIVLEGLRVTRKIIVHDTTAFFGLFGLSKRDGVNLVVTEPFSCALEYLD
jgi:hypothetical protein